MQKPRHFKGQITIVNLLMILIVIILFVVGLQPVLFDVISEQTAAMDPTTPNGDLIIMIMNLIPLFILLSIIMTAFIYAIPRREGGAQYGGM